MNFELDIMSCVAGTAPAWKESCRSVTETSWNGDFDFYLCMCVICVFTSPVIEVIGCSVYWSICRHSYCCKLEMWENSYILSWDSSAHSWSSSLTAHALCISTIIVIHLLQGVPEVVLGDPNSDEILIVWETSAACKTTASRHYSRESKCYHVHAYEDNGLRATFIDLTSLIRPEGYLVESDDGTRIRFSVCKPLMSISQDDFPSVCNGTMACLPTASSSQVLGVWSEGGEARLHMHNGLLTVEYSVNVSDAVCEPTHTRTVRIHFLCPEENQVCVL